MIGTLSHRVVPGGRCGFVGGARQQIRDEVASLLNFPNEPA